MVQEVATRGKQRTVIVTIAKWRAILPCSALSTRRKRDSSHHNVCLSAVDLDAYDFDCDELNSAKIALMTNLSRNGSNALMSLSETDYNPVIAISFLYSQYLSETQQETVQNSNSSAHQDILILSMFEQITTQVTHCNTVNKALTTELDRYKGRESSGESSQWLLCMSPDSDETLELSEKSHSKMLLKEQDPLHVKFKVNTKPINYDILNNDYYKRFVRQSDLYSEYAYWKATSVPTFSPSHSSTTIIVEGCQSKKRNTAQLFMRARGGVYNKAYFRDEIIPFIKNLKDIFNNFNQYLVDELADVQKVFYQMEQAVEQHRLESRTFEVKMNQALTENERLLAQTIDNDIVKTVVNLSVNESGETVTQCQKKNIASLLEAVSQLNQEILSQRNSVLNQNAPSFTQLFELSELKAQSQAKDTAIVKLRETIKSLNGNVEGSAIKMEMEEIETLNIELEHRVSKLVTENEHLKQI
ncbi:hypothetical protein Tco_1211472 [Tanacetum coccineum]